MNPRSDLATEMTQDGSRVVFEHVHENMRAADATAQAGGELIIRNAETIQEAVQSGAQIAVRMTEYSARNINTIVNCNADLVEVTRTMSLDWIRFAQQHFEHGFAYARRMSDESVRMADELTRMDVTEWTDHGWVQRAA
ncbi:MAG: hypothetical protein WAL40_05915 [Rhodoplanes sp.]